MARPMDAVEVTAKENFVYDGHPRQMGAVFPCSAKDARILTIIGKVELAQGVSLEDLAPAVTPEPKPKRRYRRKDMAAED